jgi:hypothetical protein
MTEYLCVQCDQIAIFGCMGKTVEKFIETFLLKLQLLLKMKTENIYFNSPGKMQKIG